MLAYSEQNKTAPIVGAVLLLGAAFRRLRAVNDRPYKD